MSRRQNEYNKHSEQVERKKRTGKFTHYEDNLALLITDFVLTTQQRAFDDRLRTFKDWKILDELYATYSKINMPSYKSDDPFTFILERINIILHGPRGMKRLEQLFQFSRTNGLVYDVLPVLGNYEGIPKRLRHIHKGLRLLESVSTMNALLAKGIALDAGDFFDAMQEVFPQNNTIRAQIEDTSIRTAYSLIMLKMYEQLYPDPYEILTGEPVVIH